MLAENVVIETVPQTIFKKKSTVVDALAEVDTLEVVPVEKTDESEYNIFTG